MSTTDTAKAVEDLLRRIDPSLHDEPRPLLRAGPAMLETLIGERPHPSKMHRLEHDGVRGIRLRVLSSGRERRVTFRWLARFVVLTGEARAAAATPKRKPARLLRRGQAVRTTEPRGLGGADV